MNASCLGNAMLLERKRQHAKFSKEHHFGRFVSISRARGDLYSIQIDVLKLVSYVRQDTMFYLRLLLFHPYINLTNTIKLNVVSEMSRG
jgi:hypothetical protein